MHWPQTTLKEIDLQPKETHSSVIPLAQPSRRTHKCLKRFIRGASRKVSTIKNILCCKIMMDLALSILDLVMSSGGQVLRYMLSHSLPRSFSILAVASSDNKFRSALYWYVGGEETRASPAAIQY